MMYWLSFCDPDKPKGAQFLGACLVEILPPYRPTKEPLKRSDRALACAIEQSWRMGVNPGGEVASIAIPPTWEAQARPYLNRLLSKAEINALDASEWKPSENARHFGARVP